MRKFKLLPLLTLAIVFIISSCTKEGPEGPVGATGAQGPGGTAGPAGPTGPQGATGTTNVTYSAWFSFASADWKDSTTPYFGDISRAIKSAPAVTQTVIDQGIVLAYVNLNPGVYPLPLNITNPFFSGETLQFGFVAAPSKLIFYLADLIFPDATGITFSAPIRYVVIPGSIAGGRGVNSITTTYEGYTANELKTMSYDQVAKIFNLPADGTNIR
ncbi:MAG: hypothetical protein WDN26_15400 [Chitinophagaceae bacterium]